MRTRRRLFLLLRPAPKATLSPCTTLFRSGLHEAIPAPHCVQQLLAAEDAPGRVFGREELLDAVWGRDGFVEPRSEERRAGRECSLRRWAQQKKQPTTRPHAPGPRQT